MVSPSGNWLGKKAKELRKDCNFFTAAGKGSETPSRGPFIKDSSEIELKQDLNGRFLCCDGRGLSMCSLQTIRDIIMPALMSLWTMLVRWNFTEFKTTHEGPKLVYTLAKKLKRTRIDLSNKQESSSAKKHDQWSSKNRKRDLSCTYTGHFASHYWECTGPGCLFNR